jgi:3-oxoacyl-[acyl-carrier-protein] synthase II
MRERVAITGIGVVTPIGVGLDAFGRALRAGTSGVRRIEAFDCTGFDTQIAAAVPDDFDGAGWVVPRKSAKLMSRSALFAVAAAAMARRAARLAAEDADPERIGVVLGAAGMGPTDNDLLATQARALIASVGPSGADWDVPSFARAFRERTNPVATLRGLPNLAAAHLAIQQDARGPNNTITTACTAGTQAIGEGLRLIQRGEADVVFAGGADAPINPVTVLGFSLLGTLSRRNEQPKAASRPFDLDRDGFVIGEGAGVVVLERESLARRRGAPALAELAGYGVTCDAYRITDERPDAAGAARAIRLCLRDGDAAASEIDYVNAHGTGTLMNDVTETRAIKEGLGPGADRVPVSSTKSMLGHLLAAAGAVEAAAVIAAICGDFLPPTINLDTADPRCDLDYVPGSARQARVDAALTNSFGFGGQNACLLIRRW